MFRKKLPYDIEIAVRSDRIGFVLHTEWFRKDIRIQYKSSSGQAGNAVLCADTREYVITGLTEGGKYELILSRKDIKGIRYKPRVLNVITGDKPYIVLIGASVGYAWGLPDLPNRLGDETFVMGYRRGKDGFDKTQVLKRLLDSENRPDAIILKECAAYFPRDVQISMDYIDNWVNMIRNKNIIPVLATVAPVTRECDEKRGPGMIASINEFNEKIREYARDHDLRIMDLNLALEDGSPGHFLRDNYAQPDGLHLSEKAYRQALDPLVNPVVTSLFK